MTLIAILHVFFESSVDKVLKLVVLRIPVEMTDLQSLGAFTLESEHDKAVHLIRMPISRTG